MSILLSLIGSNVSTTAAPPAGEPLAFQTLGLPRIDSDVYMGTYTDYNGPYDVRNATIANAGNNVRVNISMKAIMSTAFYSDWCIGGVQIYRGATQLYSWMFTNSSGGTGSGWEWNYGGTYTSAGRPHSVTQANARTYSNIVSGSTNREINWASSTASSNTGCEGGISSTSNLSASSQINQSTNIYYAYCETSSPTATGDVFYMRSPQVNVQAGDVIYVAGACATYSPQTHINTFDDAVFIGVA